MLILVAVPGYTHMSHGESGILIVKAFHFLAWLLGKSCFILSLYWGRHCINRHTGNRPSLSEEPLRRGPGPTARFPILRYRPERYIYLDYSDVLWNPFTFCSLNSFESACLTGDFHLEFQKYFFLLQLKHLLISYQFAPSCLIYCMPRRPQQLSSATYAGLFFSIPVLNYVAVMFYMSSHVFPKDFSVSNDDLTLWFRLCQTCDVCAAHDYDSWNMKLATSFNKRVTPVDNSLHFFFLSFSQSASWSM